MDAASRPLEPGSPAPSTPARPSVAGRGPLLAALTLLTALALGLRVTSLGRSLFADEAYSLALAQRSFGHMVELFGFEANGMPYPIVLWPLVRIFGTDESVLRLPAVIAGAASVPALWWAARRLVSDAAALLAAALLAVSAMAVFYSQLARPYAFVVLASCLAFGALPRALERNSRRTWAGYVAAMAALAYCDILAAPIALPAQLLIAMRAGRGGVRRWLAALGATAACCLPLLVAAVIARSRRDAIYWLPKPDRTLLSNTVQEFTGGFSEVTAVRWVTIAAALVLVGLALAGLRAGRAREAEGVVADERWALAIAAAWGVLGPLLLLAVSFVHPLFWPRYAIGALPGLCLLAAVAAASLWRSPRSALVAGGCVALIGGAALFADVRQRTKRQEDWPPAAAWLRAARAPGAPTILDNVIVLPVLGYYDPAFRAANGNLVVQEWADAPVPVGVRGFKDPKGYGSVPDGPPSAAAVRALARANGGTVWMLVSEVDRDLQGDPRHAAAVAWARSHCSVTVRESVGVWVLRATACRG